MKPDPNKHDFTFSTGTRLFKVSYIKDIHE